MFSVSRRREEADLAGRSKFGPGFLVAAAFIGPGTVTSATMAGAGYGASLLWVVVVATLVAVIVQEMTGRFSLATGTDVARALVEYTSRRSQRITLQVLSFLAIVVGCAAYEAGNIMGGSLGLHLITGVGARVWSVVIGGVAMVLLLWRKYRVIETLLIALVVVMGVSFLLSAIIVRPDISAILGGFVPRFPKGSVSLVLALVGTTVVPYNLFLHSSTVLKKWRGEADIPVMRGDIILSVGLGGLITASIVVTASVTYFMQGTAVSGPADLAAQLSPLYGPLAKLFFGIGFFAAGLSSAITAPYAASWTVAGLFGWREAERRFSLVSLGVLLFGTAVSFSAFRPLRLILMAQITNALLLPVVLLFLFYLLNKPVAGRGRNRWWQNLIFLLVWFVVLWINLKKFV